MINLLFVYAASCIALLFSINRSNRFVLLNAVWFLSIIAIYLTWLLFDMFDESIGGFQMIMSYSWLPEWGVNLAFALDGYSLWLVVLTLLLVPMSAVLSYEWIHKGLKEYLLFLYTIQFLLLGCFMAVDAFVFMLFSEGLLFPVYFILAVWGLENKNESSLWFFLHYFLSSVLLCLAFTYLASELGGFSWDLWALSLIENKVQTIFFIAASLAFIMKMPLLPFHICIIDAQTQSPSSLVILLSGLFLNIGCYGLIRWVLPIVPDAVSCYADVFLYLSFISMVFLSFSIFYQKDIKKFIAYALGIKYSFLSSCLFASYRDHNLALIDSAIMQMFAHGLAFSGLFMAFAMIYHRTQRRDVSWYGGLSNVMPSLSLWFVAYCFATIALPGTVNFASEFIAFFMLMKINFAMAVFMLASLVVSCAYMLWIYKLVFLGSMDVDRQITDIKPLETCLLAVLLAIIFWFGMFPRFLVQTVNNTSLIMNNYLYIRR